MADDSQDLRADLMGEPLSREELEVWTLVDTAAAPRNIHALADTALRYLARADELERERAYFERRTSELGMRAARAEARVEELEWENKQLRGALAAYRSALRSGEPETNRLRQVGDEAFAGSQPDTKREDGR